MVLTSAFDADGIDFMQKPIRLKSGINHIAYDRSGELMAYSDVYMLVTVKRRGDLLFEHDFNFFDDRVRPTQRVRGLAFSQDGGLLYVAAGDMVYAMDLATREISWSYVSDRSFGFLIISPQFVTAEHGLVAATFDNGVIATWSEDGMLQSRFHHNDAPRALRIVDGGQTLVGTDSFSLTTWDWQNRQRLSRVRLRERVYGFAASSVAPIVGLWTLAGTELWDYSAGKMICRLQNGAGRPALAFHPLNTTLALAERHGVWIYDFNGVELAHQPVDAAVVLSVEFNPEGSELTIGCSDATVRHWRL